MFGKEEQPFKKGYSDKGKEKLEIEEASDSDSSNSDNDQQKHNLIPQLKKSKEAILTQLKSLLQDADVQQQTQSDTEIKTNLQQLLAFQKDLSDLDETKEEQLHQLLKTIQRFQVTVLPNLNVGRYGSVNVGNITTALQQFSQILSANKVHINTAIFENSAVTENIIINKVKLLHLQSPQVSMSTACSMSNDEMASLITQLKIVLQNCYSHQPGIALLLDDSKTFDIDEVFVDLELIIPQKENQKNEENLYERREFKSDSGIQQRAIVPEALFKGGREPINRVFLQGAAGIGKTTICRHFAYLWAKEKLWANDFELVIYLPLREIVVAYQNIDYDLESFILGNWKRSATLGQRNTYGKSLITDVYQHALWQFILTSPTKVLWLLDGLDEVDRNHSAIATLLSYAPCYLVTSRPASVPNNIARCVENIGLSPANRTKYIYRYFNLIQQAEKAQPLINWLKSHPQVWGLSSIAVICQLLCIAYQQNQQLPDTLSLTQLYSLLIIQWQRRAFLRDKTLRSKLNPDKLAEWDNEEIAAYYNDITQILSKICYCALQQASGVLIEGALLKEVIKEAVAAQNTMLTPKAKRKAMRKLRRQLLSLGVLKAQGLSDHPYHDRYEFAHLTFVEYLAAYFISCWFLNPNKPLLLIKQEAYAIETFFKLSFNEMLYEMICAFIAGILREIDEKPFLELDKYFKLLTNKKGYYKTPILIMLCLEESGEEYCYSRQDLLELIQPEIKSTFHNSEEALYSMQTMLHYLRRCPTVAQQLKVVHFLQARLDSYERHTEKRKKGWKVHYAQLLFAKNLLTEANSIEGLLAIIADPLKKAAIRAEAIKITPLFVQPEEQARLIEFLITMLSNKLKPKLHIAVLVTLVALGVNKTNEEIDFSKRLFPFLLLKKHALRLLNTIQLLQLTKEALAWCIKQVITSNKKTINKKDINKEAINQVTLKVVSYLSTTWNEYPFNDQGYEHEGFCYARSSHDLEENYYNIGFKPNLTDYNCYLTLEDKAQQMWLRRLNASLTLKCSSRLALDILMKMKQEEQARQYCLRQLIKSNDLYKVKLGLHNHYYAKGLQDEGKLIKTLIKRLNHINPSISRIAIIELSSLKSKNKAVKKEVAEALRHYLAKEFNTEIVWYIFYGLAYLDGKTSFKQTSIAAKLIDYLSCSNALRLKYCKNLLTMYPKVCKALKQYCESSIQANDVSLAIAISLIKLNLLKPSAKSDELLKQLSYKLFVKAKKEISQAVQDQDNYPAYWADDELSIIFYGRGSPGKTQIIERFIEKNVSKSQGITINEYSYESIYQINLNNRDIFVHELSDLVNFKELSEQFYTDVNAYAIVFTPLYRHSYQKALKLITQIKQKEVTKPIILVANKLDQIGKVKREVSSSEAFVYAIEQQLYYFECTALPKTASAINKIFNTIFRILRYENNYVQFLNPPLNGAKALLKHLIKRPLAFFDKKNKSINIKNNSQQNIPQQSISCVNNKLKYDLTQQKEKRSKFNKHLNRMAREQQEALIRKIIGPSLQAAYAQLANDLRPINESIEDNIVSTVTKFYSQSHSSFWQKSEIMSNSIENELINTAISEQVQRGSTLEKNNKEI